MLHIISRHRYPLALSILLTCVLPSQYAGQQLRVCIVCVCVWEGHKRTCISRTSANSSRAVAAVLLLLPLPLLLLLLLLLFQLLLFVFLCLFCCSALVAAFVHSIGSNKFHLCTDNATNSATEREKEKRDREREREQQSQRVLAKN